MVERTPKTIYYCWFGDGELSATAQKCLLSWERYAPGYCITRCDERLFDIESTPWTKAAYAAGKYAYVADYVRFWAVYNFGGVYMDLGSELVRDITSLCETYSPFSAIEELSKTVNTGLIVAAPRHNPLLAEVLDAYDSTQFSDDPGFLNDHTVNQMFTRVLEAHGFLREDRLQKAVGWTLLPSYYFNPIYGLGGYHIKNNTYSVHHYSGSWIEPELKIKKEIVDAWSPILGRRLAQVLGRTVGEIKTKGVRDGILQLALVSKSVIARKWENDGC